MGWAPSHCFSVCWNRSTLPQVVGWLGREFFWVTRRWRSSASKPREDLGVGTRVAVEAGEPVVGEVGLPTLVRLRRLEPDVGGLRPLSRFGNDRAGTGQE